MNFYTSLRVCVLFQRIANWAVSLIIACFFLTGSVSTIFFFWMIFVPSERNDFKTLVMIGFVFTCIFALIIELLDTFLKENEQRIRSLLTAHSPTGE